MGIKRYRREKQATDGIAVSLPLAGGLPSYRCWPAALGGSDVGDDGHRHLFVLSVGSWSSLKAAAHARDGSRTAGVGTLAGRKGTKDSANSRGQGRTCPAFG
jgi:hypothetical protein